MRKKIYKDFLRYSEAHQQYRTGECVNLIASENRKSGAVREVSSKFFDYDSRYAEGENDRHGNPIERHYQGQKYSERMEELVAEGFRELFGADFVEPRPISGSCANQVTFKGISEHNGEKLMSLPLRTGAHITHDYTGMAGKVLGLEVSNLVFNEEEFNIDVDKSAEKIKEEEPSMVVLGASLFPFPHPVEEISSVANDVGAFTIYDAAHVLGLIAGGKFQDPLGEGADFVTSSTHKTFPGGQRGVVFGNLYDDEIEKVAKKVQYAAFPGTLSNHHLLTMAENVVAIIEMKEFGEEYSAQIIKNSKRLAESLDENGINVASSDNGFTQSHQVILDVSENGGGKEVAKKLDDANIIVNKNILPWDSESKKEDPSGIRLGTQEMTREGFKENDMKYLGELIAGIISGEKSHEDVRPEVLQLAGEKRVEYGFDSLEQMDEYFGY